MDDRKKKEIWRVISLLTRTILFLGGIVFLIAYINSNPYQPFLSAEASISSFNVSPSGLLACDIDVNVTSYNPNARFVTIYNNFKVEVYNGGVLLAEQDFTDTLISWPKAPLELKLGLATHNVDARGVEDLRAAGVEGGEARLEVRIRAATRFVWRGWKRFDYMKTKADCAPVVVRFNESSPAEAGSVGGPRHCSVFVECQSFWEC